MWSTLLALSLFTGLLAISVLLYAVFLYRGARWVGIPDVTVRKTVVITAMLVVCQPLISFGIEALTPEEHLVTLVGAVVVAMIELAFTTFVSCVLIAFVYETTFFRAFQAWLPALMPPLGIMLLVVFILRPFFIETYQVSTDSMAPNVLGWHWEAPCPRCGQPAYGSPTRKEELERYDGARMMCSRECRPCVVANPPPWIQPPDRLLVNKLLRPRRWDIVVFWSPEDSETRCTQRIVGLPGERLALRDGAVWIDGQVCEPPESLRGLEYVTDPAVLKANAWGGEGKPVQLGPDEYFVLGDFSLKAQDSRLWLPGIPGREPYAVPSAYIEGVVTHIHWPPSRWRVFR